MGALSGSRSRRDDHYTLYYKPQFPICSNFDHVSKKPRSSLSLNRTPDQSLPCKSTVARFSKYPTQVTPITREVHAPCRISRFGSHTNSCRASFSPSQMGNFLSLQYEKAKKESFDTLRYINKDKEVIEVDDDVEIGEDGVSEDSSIDELEVGYVVKRGVSVYLGQKWKESDGVVENLDNSDGVDGVKDWNCQVLSSSVTVSNDANVKVESAERMMSSLSLNHTSHSPSSIYKRFLSSIEKRYSPKKLEFVVEYCRKLLWPEKKDKLVKEDVFREPFVPLTVEEQAEVSCALSNPNRRKILVTHESSNIDITGEILRCLRPGAWLNDEVVDVYLELLKEREKRDPQKFLKCHFFSPFFYKKLISGSGGYNYQSVKRWTSQRKLGYCLFECDKIFVPIHKEAHWCLAVINRKDKKFQYLDSLRGMGTQVLKVLTRYFIDEVKDKNGKDIDVSSWKKEFVEDLPLQENMFDCGMFMIKYADFYSRDIGLIFNQKHMPYFRLRTAKELLRLKAE